MNSVELTRWMNEEIDRTMILVQFSGLFQLMYLIYSNNEDNYRFKKDGNNENNKE